MRAILSCIALLSLTVFTESQLIRQCTCSEIASCKKGYVSSVKPCADRCQKYAASLNANYAALKRCILQREDLMKNTVQCTESSFPNACAEAPGRFVQKRRLESLEIAGVAEINRMLSASGVLEGWLKEFKGVLEGWLKELKGVHEGWLKELEGVVGGWLKEFKGVLEGWLKEFKGVLEGWLKEFKGVLEGWLKELEGVLESWLKELEGVVGGVADQVQDLLAQGRKFMRCTKSCLDKSANKCADKLNCGFDLPSDNVLIATSKQCAIRSGFNTRTVQDMCRCFVGAGLRSKKIFLSFPEQALYSFFQATGECMSSITSHLMKCSSLKCFTV
uniref:Chondroitin proteoglycan 4 domain-containing protein n=1 Tax=Ascaris lumbricoides TaxID=6252 RepID=A0A9J2PP48_ASCLU